MRSAAILLLVAQAAFAQSPTLVNLTAKTGLPVKRLEVDWPHSAVEFSVRFMGLSTVRGAFGNFSGTMLLDTADITRSTINVIIQTASINTNVAFRDQHLRSPDFFDAEKFPFITFRSDKIERSGKLLSIRGPLTIHGVTRDVIIPFRQLHPLSKDAWENQRIGFQGDLTVKRSDFGIKGTAFWNSEFDPGRMSISDLVDIALFVSAKVNNVERWTNPAADSLLANIEAEGVLQAIEGFRPRLADTSLAARGAPAAVLENVGVKLMQRGRFQDAVTIYSFFASVSPRLAASATAAEAEAHLMLGHREAAVHVFERAALMDPTNTVAAEYLRVLRPPSP